MKKSMHQSRSEQLASDHAECFAKTVERGRYRAAVGFQFHPDVRPNVVDHVAHRLLFEIQQFLLENFHHFQLARIENFEGYVLHQVDQQTGATRALLLWENHPCFHDVALNARCDLNEALCIAYVNAFVPLDGSVQRPIETPTISFVLMAEQSISDHHTDMLNAYLSGREFSLGVGEGYSFWPTPTD
jgi:hypothetical protein